MIPNQPRRPRKSLKDNDYVLVIALTIPGILFFAVMYFVVVEMANDDSR